MTSIILTVTGAQAQASVSGTLTSGMVGIPVTINYDDSWEGLTKNLVCRCRRGADSAEHRTILNVGSTAVVAHEVMKAGMLLYLGVEGRNADGTLVIPTIWAMCGVIQTGANTSEDLSTAPTLPVWEQLQTEIEKIKQESVTSERMTELLADIQSAVQASAAYASQAEAAAQRAEEAAGPSQNGGLTSAQINALDRMFQICAFIKDDVSAEYNAFRAAFNLDGGGATPEEPEEPVKTLTGISATYSGGDVAAGTAVSALTGVVVTAHYSDGTSEAVTGYTLTGEIAEGENTVTVSYEGKTAAITVAGIAQSSGLPRYEYTVVGTGVLTDTGTATPSSLYDVTDFMDIDPNYGTLSVATYMDTASSARISSSTYVQWFNGDTFLSRTGGSPVIEIGKTKCTKPVNHTAPEGATRFRVCVQNNCDRFVLYKGTVSASDI